VRIEVAAESDKRLEIKSKVSGTKIICSFQRTDKMKDMIVIGVGPFSVALRNLAQYHSSYSWEIPCCFRKDKYQETEKIKRGRLS